jgi:hypothetical protein
MAEKTENFFEDFKLDRGAALLAHANPLVDLLDHTGRIQEIPLGGAEGKRVYQSNTYARVRPLAAYLLRWATSPGSVAAPNDCSPERIMEESS